MTKAFVFGKFLPFHKGHEAMIRFAFTKCNHLTILVCASDKEQLTGEIRKVWIDKTFEKVKNIHVQVLNYQESELPNTSEASKNVSQLWANKFKTIVPDCSLVITSEAYGDFVANFMEIKHIPFDLPKQLFPVSATNVRNDLFTYWDYLPESVKTDLSIKVVILGTESTGKTTLTQKLSKYFNCSAVSEAGRDLISDSNTFQFEDLEEVAEVHAKHINESVTADNPLVIIDTDIHITKSYSLFTFNKSLEVSDSIYNANKASLYLYLNNDVEYVQDGTRLSEIDRNSLDLSHRSVLKESKIPFVEIRGSWDKRFETAVESINKLISINSQKPFKYQL